MSQNVSYKVTVGFRQLAAALMTQVEQQGQAPEQSQKALRHSEQINLKLTHELALTIPTTLPAKKKPKRSPLPSDLPRTDVHHEPENEQCICGANYGRLVKRSARNSTTSQACSTSSIILAEVGS